MCPNIERNRSTISFECWDPRSRRSQSSITASSYDSIWVFVCYNRKGFINVGQQLNRPQQTINITFIWSYYMYYPLLPSRKLTLKSLIHL